MSRQIIVIAIVGLFLSGCASTTLLYDGPELPEREVSVLMLGNQMERDIIVDGDKKFRYEGAVLPGNHMIQVGYYRGFLAAGGVGNKNPEGYFSFDVTLKAGHTYYIGVARFSQLPQCAGIALWIEDIDSGKIIAGRKPSIVNLGMINYLLPQPQGIQLSIVPEAC